MAGGQALIVAHGSPSAPDDPERAIASLAEAVAVRLKRWQIAGATLAAPGALRAALGRLGQGPVLAYPLFMSDGWFATEELPRRLAEAGGEGTRVLPAFGLDPAVHQLCLTRAEVAVQAYPPRGAALVLAAHGSPNDPRPAGAAAKAAAALAASGAFREVRCGFVDEAPFLADAARVAGPAICLPYFAMRAGHVETDLPRALEEASFDGEMLDPIGTDPDVPAIIATALTRA